MQSSWLSLVPDKWRLAQSKDPHMRRFPQDGNFDCFVSLNKNFVGLLGPNRIFQATSFYWGDHDLLTTLPQPPIGRTRNKTETYTHTHNHTHSCTCTQSHTHTVTHAHSQTRTQSHTHTVTSEITLFTLNDSNSKLSKLLKFLCVHRIKSQKMKNQLNWIYFYPNRGMSHNLWP